MADYLIQDTTLDAIADAINTKLDTSVAMTPAQMVTAIGSIQTGGGGGWELIAEATTTEDVEAFRVDVPAAKQNMDAYRVQYDCTLLAGTGSSSLYGCPRINSVAVGTPYALNGATQHYTIGIAKNYSGLYTMFMSNSANGITPSHDYPSTVKYVAMVGYHAGNLVAAGSTIKVYGIGDPT